MSEITDSPELTGADAAVAEVLKRAAAAGVLPPQDSDKASKAKAEKPKAEKPKDLAPVPAARPPARLRVLERFVINLGNMGGLQVYQRGDVLLEENFEPRVWGDMLEGLNRKVAVL